MTRQRKRPEELRSHRWYGAQDLRAFGHRSRALQTGFARSSTPGATSTSATRISDSVPRK
jgi:dihydroxy-acid dehydratase